MENLDIEQIIVRSLTGELNSEEEQLLSAWLSANTGNKAIYKAYAQAWEHAADYKVPAWNTEQAWLKMEPRLSKAPANQQKASKRVRLWKRIAATAAVLLVLIAAGYGVFTGLDGASYQTIRATTADVETRLPDGSMIHLKEGASVTYPESFSGSERSVQMKGQVFFDVIPDPEKPFIVKTNRARVTVLGTSFVVDASREDNGITDLYVTEGEVQFQSLRNDQVKLSVKAGGQATYTGKVLQPVRSTSFNDIAWHTRTLEFKNIRAADAIEDISEYYHVTIDLSRSRVRDCLITAPLPFQDAALEDVLEIMKVLLDVDVSQSGQDVYVFTGGKCK